MIRKIISDSNEDPNEGMASQTERYIIILIVWGVHVLG